MTREQLEIGTSLQEEIDQLEEMHDNYKDLLFEVRGGIERRVVLNNDILAFIDIKKLANLIEDALDEIGTKIEEYESKFEEL